MGRLKGIYGAVALFGFSFAFLMLCFFAACSCGPEAIRHVYPEVVDGTLDFSMAEDVHGPDLFGEWSAPQNEKGWGLVRRVLKPDSGFFFDLIKVEPLLFRAGIAIRPSRLELRVNGLPLPLPRGVSKTQIPPGFLRPGRNALSFGFPPGEEAAFKRIHIGPVRDRRLEAPPGPAAVILTPARLRYYLPPGRCAELRLEFAFEGRRPLSAVVTIESEKKTASYGLKIRSGKEIAVRPLDDGFQRIAVEMGEAPAGRVRLVKSGLAGTRRPAAARPSGRRNVADPPNVLIIILDAARADHFSCYGYGRPTTPRIDVLAETSAVFGDAVSESAYTLASTATILTGLPPDYHGATEAFQSRLGDRTVTLAQLFSAKGYFTAAISASPFFGKAFGFDRGFARFIDFRETGRLIRAEDFLPPFRELLDERGERPFFFYLHIREPHGPFSMPPPFRGRFRKKDLEAYGPVQVKTGKRGAKKAVDRFNPEYRRDLYDENLAYADSVVGQICETLRQRGLFDRTAVFLTSDHGEALGEHGFVGHNVVLKREGIRVPLIVRLPNGPRVRKDYGHPVISSDATVTLCRLCGLSYPYAEETQGRDLFLRAGGRIRFCRSTTMDNGYAGHMVEADPYKMILFPSPAGLSIELFNIRLDPEETTPLAADALPARALRFFLRDFLLRASRRDQRETRAELGAEDIEKLRALGYVKGP